MNEGSAREWIRPYIWDWAYLTLAPLRSNVEVFSHLLRNTGARTLLDLGCGIKPYKSLFSFITTYVGFDIEKNPFVDVVGKNWDLPFSENEFDCLLTTQVLEHTAKIPETVQEIRRVVKPGGLIFISVPMTYPEHGVPYDYYRFTRYGLQEIFSGFEVVALTSSGGFLHTIFKLLNTFVNYLPYAKYWAFPMFIAHNIAGLAFEWVFSCMKDSRIHVFHTIYDIYMRMPENFMITLKNTK